MEEETAYEPPTSSYDETFPVLPKSAGPIFSSPYALATTNNSMRVGCTQVTQVFRVPMEEHKFDHSDKFGEGESLRTCLAIIKESRAHIEISSSKDQSLTFLVTGKQNEVLEARRRILTTFQTQANKQVKILKEHHGWILGKQGQRLRDLEKTTATKIQIPFLQDQSDIITISGTKEGIEKAEHEIKVISDQQKNDELSTRIEDLLSKQEVFQVTSAEHQKREEFLLSKIKALREKEVRLDSQLNELKNTHNVLIKDKNSELAHQTKQIQDLTMMQAKTNDKLIKVISNNEELSKAVTERIQEINRLKTTLKNENDEISRLNTDLQVAMESKLIKSLEIIQSLEEELLLAKERTSRAETDFNNYRDNMDKHTTRERAIHEAKLKRIESNVYDLKEKLMAITQDIHNSSEICEEKNPSNLLTDDQKHSND